MLEALSLVKAKDMTFLGVALIEAFNLFAEVHYFFHLFSISVSHTYVRVHENGFLNYQVYH